MDKKAEENTWMRFSDLGKIRVGVKTSADNVFIGNDWSGEKENIELLRPLITHRNAGQILPDNTDRWQILYTHTATSGKRQAVDIDAYPASREYLLNHYEQLAGRRYLLDANRHWYEVWVPQNPDSWAHRKIVFRDIAEHPQFWLDTSGAVVNGDCYWIDIRPEISDEIVYLALAVANSPFIERYYDARFHTKLYSGKRRYMTQYVNQFPIPCAETDAAKEAAKIVENILRANDPSLIHRHKDSLDNLVNKMFF